MFPHIRIEGEVTSAIREPIALAPVLDDLARELVERMANRIHGRGVAADGRPWSGGRDFQRSGQLRRSLGVELTARGPVIRYADTARVGEPLTNQQLARELFGEEHMSPMVPSDEEVAWFTRELARRLPSVVLTDTALGGGRVPSRMGRGNRAMKGGV